jgi:hypothetical protein
MSTVPARGVQVEWAAREYDPGTGGTRAVVRRGEVVGVDPADGALIVETGPVRYHYLPPGDVRPVLVPVADVALLVP